MAGSSGAQGRGTGIVLPFYELFGLCSFGQFKVQNGASGQYVKNDLATLATKAFQEGYDLRFGMAQAVPVVITELLIRLIWAVRRRFQYNYPIRMSSYAKACGFKGHADHRKRCTVSA